MARSKRSGRVGSLLKTLAFFGFVAKCVNGQITVSGNTFSSTTGVSISSDAATADMEARLSALEGDLERKSFHETPFHSILPPVKEGETVYGVDYFQLNEKDAEFLVPASYLTETLYVDGTPTPLKYDYVLHVFAPNSDTPDQAYPYFYEPTGDKHLLFGGPHSAEEFKNLLGAFLPVAELDVMKRHMGYAKIFENNDDSTFTTSWSESRLPDGKTFPIAILQPGWTGSVLSVKDLATLLARQGIVSIVMDLYSQYTRPIGNTHVWQPGETYQEVGITDCILQRSLSGGTSRLDTNCWNGASSINEPYTEDSLYKTEQRDTLYEQLFLKTRNMLEGAFTANQLEFDNTLGYGASLGWQQFWTLNARQAANPSAMPSTQYVQPIGSELFKLSALISSDGSHWAVDNEINDNLAPMQEGIQVPTMWVVGTVGSGNGNRYSTNNMAESLLAQSIFVTVPGNEHLDLTDKINKSGYFEGVINMNFPHNPAGHQHAVMSTLLNAFGPFAVELMIPDEASNFKEDMQYYIMQLWAQRNLLPNEPVSKMTIMQNCNIAGFECDIGGTETAAAFTRASVLHIDDASAVSQTDSVGFSIEVDENENLGVSHGWAVHGGNRVATFFENGDFSVGGKIIVGGNLTHPKYLKEYIDERVQAYIDNV